MKRGPGKGFHGFSRFLAGMVMVAALLLAPGLALAQTTPAASPSPGSSYVAPTVLAPVDFSQVYIIGVVEPTNRTGVLGHLSFPYLPQEMQTKLGAANYKVIPITPDMLQAQGINLYTATTPDLDLSTKQIIDLGTTYHLDALMAGTLTYLAERDESQLFQLRRFWHVALAGTLYEVKAGQPVWTGDVVREERYDNIPDPNQQAAIKVQADIGAVDDLAALFLKTAGLKPADTAGPVISIDYPTQGAKMRTEVVVVLGKVTDGARISALEFNGQAVDIFPKAEVPIYQPVYLPYKDGDKIASLNIKATDIYGNTATVQMNLPRTAPPRGFVKQIDTDNAQIRVDIGSYDGMSKGMSMMLFDLEKTHDPVTGAVAYTTTPIDPVVVVTVYNHSCIVKMIHPEKASQVKIGDLVR